MHSDVHIRMCNTIWESEHVEHMVGLTLFHELLHMVSAVGDKAYDKVKLFDLARNDPDSARLNAENFCLFAMEAGMSKTDYAKYTDGLLIKDNLCRDQDLDDDNCFKQASKCCDAEMRKKCCASCDHFDNTQKCKALSAQEALKHHHGSSDDDEESIEKDA